MHISKYCKEGVCPLCGGTIVIGSVVENEDAVLVGRWHCVDCKASGEQNYALIFNGKHTAVKTADGEEVQITCPSGGNQPGVAYHALLEALPSEGKVFTSDGKNIFCKSILDAWTMVALLKSLGIYEADYLKEASFSYKIVF